MIPAERKTMKMKMKTRVSDTRDGFRRNSTQHNTTSRKPVVSRAAVTTDQQPSLASSSTTAQYHKTSHFNEHTHDNDDNDISCWNDDVLLGVHRHVDIILSHPADRVTQLKPAATKRAAGKRKDNTRGLPADVNMLVCSRPPQTRCNVFIGKKVSGCDMLSTTNTPAAHFFFCLTQLYEWTPSEGPVT